MRHLLLLHLLATTGCGILTERKNWAEDIERIARSAAESEITTHVGDISQLVSQVPGLPGTIAGVIKRLVDAAGGSFEALEEAAKQIQEDSGFDAENATLGGTVIAILGLVVRNWFSGRRKKQVESETLENKRELADLKKKLAESK